MIKEALTTVKALKFKSDRGGIEIKYNDEYDRLIKGSNQTVAGLKCEIGTHISKRCTWFKSDRGGIEINYVEIGSRLVEKFKSDRGGIEIQSGRSVHLL